MASFRPMGMAAAGALTVCMLLWSCAPSPLRGPETGFFDPSEQEAGEAAVWPFWPANMRIHPLTRLTQPQEAGRQILEARIEFTDSEGHSSKAVGHLELRLLATRPGGRPPGAEIEQWDIALWEPETNRRHFDHVTNTYLLRLGIDDADAAAELRATFTSTNGDRFEARHRISE